MPDMIVKNDVVFAGENPLVMLYAPDTDDPVAVASYWKCSYSPAGEGQALVMWADPDGTGLGDLAPTGIYTDNPAMARLVWDHFNSHFDRLQGHGIEEVEPEAARFMQQADGLRLHRVSCSVCATSIELEWRDALEVLHTLTTTTAGDSDWEVTSVICPCAAGGIRVNGVAATGEVHQPEGDFRSSAFLAFAESWVRIG